MQKSRKKLSPAGLLEETWRYFSSKFSEKKKKRRATDPSLVDSLMACVAVFHLKFASLLEYDVERCQGTLLFKNLKRLYHIDHPPCDTSMREKVDLVEPAEVRGIFKKIFAHAQRGKVLEFYEFWNKHYLLSVDGTGQFSSTNIHCENCCEKHHGNGEVSYYHQALAAAIVHPDMKRVIPLAPEAITKQDGATKNDCEQNAAKRLLKEFRREHPHLKVVVNEDSLYATGPHIQLLKELQMSFIIGAKPGNLGFLFDWVGAADLQEYRQTDKHGKRYTYRFINQVPLNDTHFSTRVNFLEYWEEDPKGKVQHFAFITDIELTKETVELVMRGGRARWRIENETFNTLKNQGYHFEHNYGHGKKNLCTVMGMLMMLVFLIDQLSELCDAAFQEAKAAARTYATLWQKMRAAIDYCELLDWDATFHKVVQSRARVNSS